MFSDSSLNDDIQSRFYIYTFWFKWSHYSVSSWWWTNMEHPRPQKCHTMSRTDIIHYFPKPLTLPVAFCCIRYTQQNELKFGDSLGWSSLKQMAVLFGLHPHVRYDDRECGSLDPSRCAVVNTIMF